MTQNQRPRQQAEQSGLPTIDENSQWCKSLESSAAKFAESTLDFSHEKIFATEQLLKNSYSLSVAIDNPESLKLAMFNVSAMGLSLNPSMGLAYLVPRRLRANEKPRIVLDISYRGLIAIGVETGSILWAKSELVCANDTFVYKGPAEKPEHIFDPFGTPQERGALRGAYCMAELPSGSFMIEPMSKTDMDKIRDKSEAFKNNVGPWIDWPEQMQLKCPVKRGSKWWPKSTPRLSNAIQLLNEVNGEGLAALADASNTVVSLPPPLPRNEIPQDVLFDIDRHVQRAVQNGAYEACKELMESRMKHPGQLAFALKELDDAKSRQSANPNQNQVVSAQ